MKRPDLFEIHKLFKGTQSIRVQGVRRLPLEDYLMPNETIKYQSTFDVQSSGKPYTVILTNLRLILYSRRGLLFKGDDVVTEAIRDIQGIKYKETGAIFKSSFVEIICTNTKRQLAGNPASLKALYQQLLPFLTPEMRQPMTAQTLYMQGPPVYQNPVSQQESLAPTKFCPNCGIELSTNNKFCGNCGKPL